MNEISQLIAQYSLRLQEFAGTSEESFDHASSSIAASTEVTEDIAEHLHVLAINTAVEAARAGEVGRGFTIISKEIQKLSRKAPESIRDVENRVGNVRQKIDDVSASLEQSSDSARSTLSKLAAIAGRFEQIHLVFTLLREQLCGFREIVRNQLKSEKQIAESVRDITRESDSIAEQSGLAVDLAASLESVMQDVLKEVGSGSEGNWIPHY
ncbi:MAG TPA: methyl-accepting chemotaxis protein [Spirochaetia bacterium]|nr:methyl-accepting chemotaxis protein [Spirochaetia bacterium]